MKFVQIWNRIWRKRLSLIPNSYSLIPNSSPLPEFTFLNVTATPNGWNDKKLEKLWLYNLHYFDYLNNEKVKVEGVGEQWKDLLVDRWIRENPVGWGNGWEPYPISLRVVNWVKWLVREQESGNRKEEIERSLEEQVGYLEKRLEYHLLANHLLANAKALVFAGVYLKNGRWLKKGLAIYRKELPEQTCADGVNFERSPMYHCIILEDVLDCVWVMNSHGEHVERGEVFREYVRRMLAGLELLTGPDGKIAKFNDSTEGIAKSPDELWKYAEQLGIREEEVGIREEEIGNKKEDGRVEMEKCRESGFVRMQAGVYTLLAKCGEIGPSYQPGHAHADTFSFELWRGTEKIVGDTGCSTYVPGEIRSYERSTAAHNTVVIGGKNSSEVWAAHRVGRRFDPRTHHRTFKLTEQGLSAVDEISVPGEIEIRFHLPPGVDPDSVAIDCPGQRTVETCPFAMGWNKREMGTCVIYSCGHAGCATLPVKFEWSIK